ncbi:SMODS-associated NUDIX domain-containing protein [Algoriphagus antarcticus]|uniref:SMODS-associated NUDIX domain-containing protein n=1 Tax=Algoriphagus antarcticus TaxID=238540 RepID=UPI00196AA00C
MSPWREFCEELISEAILPWKQFRFIDYEFKKKIQSPIINLDGGGKGIFVFEIYDLVINNEQLPILKKLKESKSDKFIWVSDNLIQSLGHNIEMKEHIYEISPHTRYAQNLKWK